MATPTESITFLALTDSGCEDACATEIRRLIGGKPDVSRNTVSIDCGVDDAAILAYRLQTARRALVVLAEGTDADAIAEGHLDGPLVRQLIPEGVAFKVEGDLLRRSADEPPDAERDEPAQGIIETIGGWAKAELGNPVSLTRPDIILVVCQTPERAWLGVDLVGKTLAKRDYRIMVSRRSLKATIAAAAVVESGAKTGETILDPIGDDGTIGIEAAMLLNAVSPRRFLPHLSLERMPLFSGRDWAAWRREQDARAAQETIVRVHTDSLRDMKAVRTNSKLAGVDKLVHSTRVAVDWVDLKIEEGTIRRIITAPIQSGKSVSEKDAARMGSDLFSQAGYLLDRTGTITCVTEKPEELEPAAEEHGFTEDRERRVLMGRRPMSIVTFKKAVRKR